MKPILFLLLVLITGSTSFAQDTTITFTINFPKNKTGLTKEIKTTLDSVARIIKERSVYCSIQDCNHGENEKRNTTAWDRVNNMVTYLVKKQGVNGDRIFFAYNTGCINEELVISFTTTNHITPAPHPNLRKKKSERPRYKGSNQV